MTPSIDNSAELAENADVPCAPGPIPLDPKVKLPMANGYLACMGAAILLNLLSSFQQVFYPQMFVLHILILVPLGLLGVGILIFKVLFELRAWSAIPEAERKMDPILAVVLLFVPFFNLYWQFRAIRGLSIRTDEALARRGLREIAPVNLGTLYCIYTIAMLCVGMLGGVYLVISILSKMNFKGGGPPPNMGQIPEVANFILIAGIFSAPMQLVQGLWIEYQCRATHTLYGATENPTTVLPRMMILLSTIAFFFFSLLFLLMHHSGPAGS